jgi:hypothetical protein
MSDLDRPQNATRLDWVLAAAACGGASLLLVVLVGFAVLSDCTSESGCSTSACWRGCETRFDRHWAIATGGLVAVTILSVPLLQRMAPVAIVLASVGAGLLMIRFR